MSYFSAMMRNTGVRLAGKPAVLSLPVSKARVQGLELDLESASPVAGFEISGHRAASEEMRIETVPPYPGPPVSREVATSPEQHVSSQEAARTIFVDNLPPVRLALGFEQHPVDPVMHARGEESKVVSDSPRHPAPASHSVIMECETAEGIMGTQKRTEEPTGAPAGELWKPVQTTGPLAPYAAEESVVSARFSASHEFSEVPALREGAESVAGPEMKPLIQQQPVEEKFALLPSAHEHAVFENSGHRDSVQKSGDNRVQAFPVKAERMHTASKLVAPDGLTEAMTMAHPRARQEQVSAPASEASRLETVAPVGPDLKELQAWLASGEAAEFVPEKSADWSTALSDERQRPAAWDANQALESRPEERGKPEIRDFVLSIGSIQLTVEEPAAAPSPAKPQAPASRPTAGDGTFLNWHRYHLRF